MPFASPGSGTSQERRGSVTIVLADGEEETVQPSREQLVGYAFGQSYYPVKACNTTWAKYY